MRHCELLPEDKHKGGIYNAQDKVSLLVPAKPIGSYYKPRKTVADGLRYLVKGGRLGVGSPSRGVVCA